MFKTAAKIILYGLIAWLISPVLEIIMPIPTESMVEGFLNLKDDSDQSFFNLLRYIVWIVFIALTVKYGSTLLSFALPISKRYTASKRLRQFQGVFAELFVFGFIFLFVGSIAAIMPSYKQFDKVYNVKKEEWKNPIFEAQIEYADSMKSIRGRAKKFIELNKFKYNAPFDIWPTVPSKRIADYSIQDVIDNPKDYERVANKWYNGQSYTEIEYDIRRTKEYQNYFNEQKDYYELDSMLNAIYYSALINDSLMNGKSEEAKDATWEHYGGPLKLVSSQISEYFWIILIITIVISGLDYYSNRAGIGAIHGGLLRFLEQGRFGLGGSARFAGLFEEWQTLYKNQKQGLFMGRSLYNPFLNIGLEDSRHMMTIAGSRGGKGATAIIPNLLLWEGSALVIDPKGSNAIITARRRITLGQKVHLIDPFEIATKKDRACFNPLQFLDPKSPTIREEINVIAEALVVPDEHQKDRHWDDGARTLIAGLIGHLVSSPKYEKPTLLMLRDLISMMPEDQAELWAEMSLNEGAGRLPKDAANRIIRGIGTNEISSIISNADKHTEWLSSPAMKESLSSSSFSFADLKNEPTTIYLILPPQFLETHNRFLRLFVNLSIGQMAVGGKAKVPVLLLMDEFLALGKMQEVEKAFGLMAGYNLIMWPFIQDLGRLKQLYGNSVNAFIANCRAVQVFAVADEETKEFVSKNLDKHYLGNDKKTKSTTDIVDLRTPGEVAIDIAADTNRQYILRSGKAPLVIEKVPYYDSNPLSVLDALDGWGYKKTSLFEGHYDKDPDY